MNKKSMPFLAFYKCILELVYSASVSYTHLTFPDEDPRPHMPNECMPVKSLLKASDIYYEALVELACTKR